MNTKQRTIIWFLVVILTVPALTFAIRKGRLVGRVVDPEGNPIPGVTVTATSPDIPDFSEVETTDKKGVFKVDFDTLDVTYQYRFEKAGYQTVEADQHWSLASTGRHDFVMRPGETPTVDGIPPTSTSHPAISAFNSGVAAFKARDYATAEAKFEEAVGHDPNLRQGWGALSTVRLEQGKYQKAAEAAEKAIALGSTDVMVLRTRWEAYRYLGDEAKAAEAQEDLERTGRLTEEAKKVYNEGIGLLKAGDEEGAYAKFQEAVEFDANLREAQFAVATTALKVGHDAEAAAAAKAILDENPQDAEAIGIRYNAALKLGDEAMLIDALVGLAAVEPEVARDGLWKLALAAYDVDDMARATERFGKVLEVHPDNARAHYYLGLIYVGEGANEEAQHHLQRFLELTPDDPDAATASDLVAYLSEL